MDAKNTEKFNTKEETLYGVHIAFTEKELLDLKAIMDNYINPHEVKTEARMRMAKKFIDDVQIPKGTENINHK